MATFIFDAPALFDAGAQPALARQKRVMGWLRDRLAARGVTAFGPAADVLGWRLLVQGEDGHVTIRLERDGGGGRPFAVIVERFGDAEAEYEETVAAFEDALSGKGAVDLFAYDLSA